MSGYDPNEESLILSEGADYVQSYTEKGVQWPPGSTAVLSFPTLSGVGPFPAIVNETAPKGGTASFKIPKAQTTAATIPRGTPYRLHLTKNTGAAAVTYLWFRGRVERQD
ncbi:hypothetical protein SEA_MARGARET_31 [Gordonia phage Margaret]|nr:hypothetical protein SEA_MARGARET_31 [Gordonia phage Margaret]